MAAGGTVLLLFGKAPIHLFFNHYHSPFFDQVFVYLTFLGDFTTVLVVIILLLFVKYGHALLVASGNIISALIAQGLKHFIFPDVVRPKEFFRDTAQLYLVPGYENWSYYSFPSGHTTAAFTLYLCLAFVMKRPGWKLFFFCLALLVGYSRVYLSQHFLSDIYAGSIIGTLTATIGYYLIRKPMEEKRWMGSSLRKAMLP